MMCYVIQQWWLDKIEISSSLEYGLWEGEEQGMWDKASIVENSLLMTVNLLDI